MERQELEGIRRQLYAMERRWRFIAVGCIAGGIMVATLTLFSPQAASHPVTLRAQRIEIADRAGRVRIALAEEPDGQAAISVRDVMGRPRISVVVASDASPALLLTSGHQARLLLTVGSGGTPMLMLADDAGQPRINLQITPVGGQGLWFYGPQSGNQTLALVTSHDGTSTLQFSDAAGPRIGLVTEAGGAANLAIFDVMGRPLFRAP